MLQLIEKFKKDGFIVLPDVLSSSEINEYILAIDKIAAKSKTFIGGYLRESNIIEKDLIFADLINHSTTFSYVQALLYGYPRLMSTEAIIRPNSNLKDDPVRWHEDGPNSPSYRQLSFPAPTIQVKVGYFLNDILSDDSGNLVVLPGSHLLPNGPPTHLATSESVPNAVQLKVKAGSAVIFHSALWHCVQPNDQEISRYSIYIGYCLPWMAPFDRSASSITLRSLLKKEQRELLMDFENPSSNYTLIKELWRGNPKLVAASQLRMLYELFIIRLKNIKRKLLGNSIN